MSSAPVVRTVAVRTAKTLEQLDSTMQQLLPVFLSAG